MRTLPNLVIFRNARSSVLAPVGLALILVLAPVASRAQTLLAGWSFNDQTSQTAALTADSGTLAGSATFATGSNGSNNTLTLNHDGTISLGGGEVLYSAAINSTSFASLRTGVTIYARFTLNAAGSTTNSSIFGLTTSTPPVTGSGYTGTTALGYQILTQSGSTYPVRAIGTESDNTTGFGAGSGYNTISQGTENTAAIVFSSSGTSITYSDDTNGASVGRSANTTNTLAQFTDLAVGRLLTGGSDGAITLNEFAVYQGALTSAQIAALPEPATWAGGIGLTLILTIFARRLLYGTRVSGCVDPAISGMSDSIAA